MRGMRIMHGPTMSQYLDGLSQGRIWAWLLTLTLALVALAIVVKELDERKTKRVRMQGSDDPEARRWLNGLKARKAKASRGDRRRR